MEFYDECNKRFLSYIDPTLNVFRGIDHAVHKKNEKERLIMKVEVNTNQSKGEEDAQRRRQTSRAPVD